VRANAHLNPSTHPDAVALLESDDDEDVRTVREVWWTHWDEDHVDLRTRVRNTVAATQSWARRWAL
jgi:hypothetical protein